MSEAYIEKRFENVANSKTFHNLLTHLDLKEKAVLDVGCSYGEFLIHFGEESIGVSISPDEVKYGERKGLTLIRGNIEEGCDGLAHKQFDAIFANNIFEHLYSPHAFLVSMKKHLRNNGELILGVPVIPKIKFLLHISKFKGSLAVSHINFFTRDTLLYTVERAGWKIFEARSFYFRNPVSDRILSPIAPHIYVVARPDPEFAYHEKRLRELQGYEHA